MIDREQLLTVEDVAARLQVSLETVRRMLRSGRLHGTQPISKRGGWRVTEDDLARFLGATAPRPYPGPSIGNPNLTPRRAATAERGALPGLARALAEADRRRLAGDLDGAERWEQIAASIAAGRQAAPNANDTLN